MATINNVTFNMINLRPVAVHRNTSSEQPGSDTNFITDMGYDGLVLRLEGYESTLATYDGVISEFMKTGAQTLVHRTGWQFNVYSAQLSLDLIEGFADNYYPYDLILYTSTPYRESTTETTRSKTITTNNQEWSADDSANDIDTSGSVDAVPDIQLTGGAVGATYNRDRISHEDLDATEYNSDTTSYVLKKTFTYAADANRKHHLSRVGCEGRFVNTNHGDVQVRYSIAGAADVVIDTYSIDLTTYVLFSTDTDVTTAVNESLEVKYYIKSDGAGEEIRIKNTVSDGHELAEQVCKTPQIYNTADTTVKCDVANEVEPDMVFRINTDGTGTIDYDDDFSTDKYLDAYWDMSGISHDTGNDELDVADDGYIYYKVDTKYPVTGIPTITSQINITAGTPTIQIAANSGGEPVTWYDIDTAIVDDVSTIYELNDSTNLSLKGSTVFFWRIDCVKAAAATCSVKFFELDVTLATIDAEHPKITSNGAASTFRCDQDSNSAMNCTVALYYRDRSWPA